MKSLHLRTLFFFLLRFFQKSPFRSFVCLFAFFRLRACMSVIPSVRLSVKRALPCSFFLLHSIVFLFSSFVVRSSSFSLPSHSSFRSLNDRCDDISSHHHRHSRLKAVSCQEEVERPNVFTRQERTKKKKESTPLFLVCGVTIKHLETHHS